MVVAAKGNDAEVFSVLISSGADATIPDSYLLLVVMMCSRQLWLAAARSRWASGKRSNHSIRI